MMVQDYFRFIIDKILSLNKGPEDKAVHSDPDLHTPEEILVNLCSQIKRTSELDMERQVHDIIISNVTYENSGKTIDHTAMGPLIHKKGVCDGISNLAKMVFDRIGIKSQVVVGILDCSNDTPGLHAWNIVHINGQWYHLDITADLGLTAGKKHIRYDYFNLSDSEISHDHKLNSVPVRCTTSHMDYYTLNGLFVQSVEEFDRAVEQALRKSDRTLTVRLPFGMDPAVTQSKLLERVERYCARMSRLGYSIVYTMNPDQMIFSFTVR